MRVQAASLGSHCRLQLQLKKQASSSEARHSPRSKLQLDMSFRRESDPAIHSRFFNGSALVAVKKERKTSTAGFKASSSTSLYKRLSHVRTDIVRGKQEFWRPPSMTHTDGTVMQFFRALFGLQSNSIERRMRPDLHKDQPKSWIAKLYKHNVITQVEFCELKSWRINLIELQRMRLQKLKYRLIEQARKLYEYEGENEDWDIFETYLKNYLEALQQYDYMEHGREDHFVISGERYLDRQMLRAVMDEGNVNGNEFRFDANHPTAAEREPVLSWEMEMGSVVSTRSQIRKDRFVSRLGVSAVGAAFLIGPMWLMILVGGRLTALWSSTAFIAVFGLFMAIFLDNNMSVLSATAAYAAVLVVFVALVAETEAGDK